MASKKANVKARNVDPAVTVLADTKQLSSHAVGKLIQMDPSSVVKWTSDGLLKTYTTPGGHRRILVRDLREFLTKTGMFVPPEIGGV